MTAPSFNIGDDVTVTNDTNPHVGDGGTIYGFNNDGTVRIDLFHYGAIKTFATAELELTIHATNTPVAYYKDTPVFVCGTPSDVEENAMRDRMARDMRAALRAIGTHITPEQARTRVDVLADKRGWTA